tara:strand:+ start:3664 stop:5475 length:1812 start_codon:yes stop_codon:yes gene_type:complete
LGLENLKSVFQDSLNDKIRDYKSRNVKGVEDSQIAKNIDTPILDTLIRGQIYTTGSPPILSSVNSFVNDISNANGTHPFQLQSFLNNVIDAKPFEPAKIPTDYSSAGIEGEVFSPLSKIQQNIYTGEIGLKETSWERLYNADHSPKDGVGISYSSNVNRDNLNIRNQQDGRFGIPTVRSSAIGAIGKFLGELGNDNDFQQFLQDTGKEPYIVSKIPTKNDGGINGRLNNFGSRDLPIARSITDAVRLAKYLTSPAGLAFAVKQNILGLNTTVTSPANLGGEQQIVISPQRYNTLYNPVSTVKAAGLRLAGQGLVESNLKIRRDIGGDSIASLIGVTDFLADSKSYPDTNILDPLNLFGGGSNIHNTFMNEAEQIIDKSSRFPIAAGVKTRNPAKKSGDKQTNLDLFQVEDNNTSLEELFGDNTAIVEDTENGMPFYFKDMRDGTFIVFRAYLEGINENVAPSYTSTNYIGRSEPVYTYERSEREINFSIKLIAQTPDELNSIYKKMNRLTSLCYPEYVGDEYGKNRMKPPLTKFRLGEMFGSSTNEMMGYIKNLSYSVEQSSTWETEKGKRVPRHITAAIGYQVIHGKVPNMDTKFYGFVGAN